MDRKTIFTIIATSAITALLVTLGTTQVLTRTTNNGISVLTGTSSPVVSHANDNAVVSAVSKANPAVVSIIITKNVPILERYYETVPGPFGGFFDDFLQIPQYRERGTEQREVGGGSGFFATPDGYVVTNHHVVSETNAEYTVYTNDGKKHTARVVAQDPSIDIAVLKVDAAGVRFPFLTFIDSKALNLGQTVIAIGNSLGEFRNTVSVGVISGLSRSIVAGDGTGDLEELNEVIQTDAAINPGNSGGPLLDLNGNVVGVNVAVAINSQNVGFALPSEDVRAAVESIIAHGTVVRPYMGIRYTIVTPSVKESLGLAVDYGVLVNSGTQPGVVKGSPAEKAGIKNGDIVLEFEGTKITPEKKLATLVRSKKVGDIVSLKILRDGKELTIRLILEELKD